MPVNTTIKIRKGTESEWNSLNPVLASGEPGYVINKNQFKIGDGFTNWNSLGYASVVPSGFIAGSGINLNLGSNGSSLSIGISGNFIASTGSLDVLYFNTNIEPTLSQGQMAWNDTEGTVDIALTDVAIINIGEHEVYRVRNQTGGALYKGQAVMASGVHANGIILPSLYTANGSVREIRFMGLVYENVNHNNNGYVIHFGHVNNIDTRGNVASNIAVGDETWADGDILYVHPTVPGKLTKNEPKHSIFAAIILDAASNGKIFVRPTSYGHLNDNHDVSVSGATNGQFLQYNSSTDYWVSSSSGNFSTLLVNGTGVSVSGHTHTASQITDFNEAVDDRIGSGLFVAGTGINLNYNDAGNSFTVSVSGLVNNPTNNRLLTSRDNTTTGIDAESNATFDGSTLFVPNLDVSVSGDIDTLKINKFFHNNLAVASGLGNNDLLIAIINPTGTATTEVIQGSVLRSSLLNQPAQLQFRQGTDAERLLITPASGEPIWTTDSQKFYIGDGSTVGGDFVGPSPYDRGVGTNSVVISNSGCEAIGNNSVVLGGINNLAIGVRSFIGGGSNNVAALKVRKANILYSSTNTITVLNATAADFDNTTANALRIVYISGASRLVTSRTVSSATQSGANVTLVLTSNVGATSPNEWYNVIVVNTAETDNSIGQVVNGNGNLCSGSNSTVGGGLQNTSSGTSSTVGGGTGNTSRGIGSTIGGGIYNTSGDGQSTVGGGSRNTSNSYHSTVGGGYYNTSNGYGSTIGGGRYNQSGGISSVVSGGGWYNPITEISEGNTASADISTVGGGAANSATSMGSVVSGGFSNTSSNIYTTIGGGKSNTCSGVIASVGGGTINNASGQNSVISGGSTNTASGQNSVIGGGFTNTASASASTVGGGNTNSVTALASTVPGGLRAKATRYGELSHAAGYFAVVGDAQHTVLIARRSTNNATANQVLFLDGSSARLTLPPETTWTFTIKLSAYNDTDNQGGWWIFRGGIRRNAASGTTLIGSLITESGFESSFNTASTSVVADDTNEALEIRVTGVASKNIRWVAVVDISQVSYGTP